MTAEYYTYAEPDTQERTVFLDQDGKPHFSRDDAITSNIKLDTERYIRGQLVRAWPDDSEQRKFMAASLVSQIAARHNKELRQMVADLINATA